MLDKLKKTKFQRFQKGKIQDLNFKKSSSSLKYGSFGLKILKKGRLTIKQIEAARRMISRYIRKKDKLWIRCFTNFPVTAKPKEIRMGKGKGLVSHWVMRVSAGQILFEWSWMLPTKAKMLFNFAANKLPLPSIFLYKKSFSKKLI